VSHANHAGETALLWAIPASWPEQAPPCAADGVNRLLAAGAGVNARSRDGETVLHEAIGRKQLALVRLLLLRGADPNLKGGKQNGSPLMHAVAADQAGIVAALLAAGADPREPGLLQSVSGGPRSSGDAVREALRKGGVRETQGAD
jgi:ankyrin repeat protein